jgi:DUF917 family protein
MRAFVDFASGAVASTGRVSDMTDEGRTGHFVTTVRVQGTPECWKHDAAGRQERVMAGRVDDKLAGVLPDLLCVLEPVTGRGVISVELRPGLDITVVRVPCHHGSGKCCPLRREHLSSPESVSRVTTPKGERTCHTRS